jgi:hypothetical protein
MFLKQGRIPMPAPNWPVWALLVDGRRAPLTDNKPQAQAWNQEEWEVERMSLCLVAAKIPWEPSTGTLSLEQRKVVKGELEKAAEKIENRKLGWRQLGQKWL